MNDILNFSGDYLWLSNFHPATVVLDGVTYPSVENAYQAAKTNPKNRIQFETCTARQAKKFGKKVPMVSDWDAIKIRVMDMLVQQKFADGSELAEKLKATSDAKIVEGNWWGDVFWGVCRGEGKNILGEILMSHRTRLQQG